MNTHIWCKLKKQYISKKPSKPLQIQVKNQITLVASQVQWSTYIQIVVADAVSKPTIQYDYGTIHPPLTDIVMIPSSDKVKGISSNVQIDLTRNQVTKTTRSGSHVTM